MDLKLRHPEEEAALAYDRAAYEADPYVAANFPIADYPDHAVRALWVELLMLDPPCDRSSTGEAAAGLGPVRVHGGAFQRGG